MSLTSASSQLRPLLQPARRDPAGESVPLAARLPELIGAPPDALDRLQSWRLAIVGAGSVGRRIALHASRLMPGRLLIIDPATYTKPAGLITQDLHPSELGLGKAEQTAAACQAVSPQTRVDYAATRLEDLPPEVLVDVDLVLLSSDNLAAEVETARRCRELGLPAVQAAVHGETLVAQVRCVANTVGGPCLACHYTADEWTQAGSEMTFSCQGAGDSAPLAGAVPTRSTSFLCSLSADLAMMQALRHRLELGRPVADSILSYCGYTHHTTVAPLAARPDCPIDHHPWQLARAPRPLPECTAGELLAAAGFTANEARRATLSIWGHRWVKPRCSRCTVAASEQFVRGTGDAPECAGCGGRLEWSAFAAEATVSGDWLPLAVLAEMGVSDDVRAVLLAADRSVLVGRWD